MLVSLAEDGWHIGGCRSWEAPRHHRQLAHRALVVALTGCTLPPRPVGHRPPADPLPGGGGTLVVLAVVVPRLLGPRLLDDLGRLLVDLAVVVVDRGAVHRRAGDVVLLAQHVDPAVLVAAGESGVDAPLGQMVEDGQLLDRKSTRLNASHMS